MCLATWRHPLRPWRIEYAWFHAASSQLRSPRAQARAVSGSMIWRGVLLKLQDACSRTRGGITSRSGRSSTPVAPSTGAHGACTRAVFISFKQALQAQMLTELHPRPQRRAARRQTRRGAGRRERRVRSGIASPPARTPSLSASASLLTPHARHDLHHRRRRDCIQSVVTDKISTISITIGIEIIARPPSPSPSPSPSALPLRTPLRAALSLSLVRTAPDRSERVEVEGPGPCVRGR
eukprot:2364357-Rhodomonas_salina.7